MNAQTQSFDSELLKRESCYAVMLDREVSGRALLAPCTPHTYSIFCSAVRKILNFAKFGSQELGQIAWEAHVRLGGAAARALRVASIASRSHAASAADRKHEFHIVESSRVTAEYHFKQALRIGEVCSCERAFMRALVHGYRRLRVSSYFSSILDIFRLSARAKCAKPYYSLYRAITGGVRSYPAGAARGRRR